MAEQGYRLFYRIALTNPPTVYDFQSALERGLPEPTSQSRRDVWDGLSVYSTLNQARRKQRVSPWLGEYIVVLRVPIDGTIRFQRTLKEDGHHTIWETPEQLSSLVVSVEVA